MKTINIFTVVLNMVFITIAVILFGKEVIPGVLFGFSLGIAVRSLMGFYSSLPPSYHGLIGLTGDLESLMKEWDHYLYNEEKMGRKLYRIYLSPENAKEFFRWNRSPVHVMPIEGLPNDKFTLEYIG